MSYRHRGLSQSTAAAKANLSERSGRRIERHRQGTGSSARHWRTRSDPLHAVWESELLPLLRREPALTGLSLLEHLEDHHPGQYDDRVLRTLQRRVAQWRATAGPAQEVMFRQQAIAGQLGLSDFTRPMTAITIAGRDFPHLLYQFRLHFSGWRSVTVVQGGESYSALASGLQRALSACGGAPALHRTDSLSAARNNRINQWSDRYEALCTHYGMRPTRNAPGLSHHNGAIECAHGSFKRRLDQALKRRGSADFATVADYQAFVDTVVARLNRRVTSRFADELAALQPLPARGFSDFDELSVKVTRSSTMEVRRVTYSVPSQLIGRRLRLHLYHDCLVGYLDHREVLRYERVYPRGGRGHAIDYRHLIDSLSAKPQAFRGAQLRDHILPSDTYRQLWHVIDRQLPAPEACRWIVTVLRIAAHYGHEQSLGETLLAHARDGQIPSREQLLSRYLPRAELPTQTLQQHTLADYDHYLTHCDGKAA